VLSDQLKAYDRMRHRCPVAFSDYMQWSLFRHAEVMRALHEHETFSNAVSAHVAVPNGMDPPEQTAYRRIIDPYFNAGAMATFEPVCRRIAVNLAKRLPVRGEMELMGEFAQEYALQTTCAFMGWPADLHEPLRQWVEKNHAATLARDRQAMAAVAVEFDGHIRELLKILRASGEQAPNNVTTRLLQERVQGRALSDEEIVSIVRNWTVGELATMAASVGVIAHFLADRPQVQRQLRAQPSLLPAAIDEILRMDAPLITNRRILTRATEIGGRMFQAGERFTIMWASANRDEAVFGNPDEFRLDRDPSLNLLYGAGVHVCPGAPLARLELRIATEELLARTLRITRPQDKSAVRAVYPAGGYSSVPLWIESGSAFEREPG
jgi:hypothetical protein